MQTLTEEEFKSRYGISGLSKFGDSKREESLFDAIKADIAERGQKNADILSQSGTGIAEGFEVAANTASGVGNAIGETLTRTPVIGGAIKKVGGKIKSGFDKVTDKLGGTKFFQEAAEGLEPGNNLEKGLRVGAASGEIAGNILGADLGVGAIKKGADTATNISSKVSSSVPRPNVSGVGKYVKGAIRDVVPTRQQWIDESLAKGLDLTPGDLTTIEKSTGNQVGKWLSDNNLIGTNKVTTEGLISGFFKQNYDAVRSSIDKVKISYKLNQVPRFYDALKQVQKNVEGVPGLEKAAVEVDNLLNKTEIKLTDVQRVKELLDDNFNLYKATGDVKEGVIKEGLANMRSEIKAFIEGEVKKNIGEDISLMNNSVMTSRAITDAIKNRSNRGLTRTNVSHRDVMIGLGLYAFGSPYLGVAYVFMQKLASSPTARLRFARWLDKRSDGEKKKVTDALNKGTVPKEVERVIETTETQ